MHKKKQHTAKTDAYSISRQVIDMLEDLATQEGVTEQDIKVISIATAGPIDADKGEIFNNANLGFKNVPLKEPIAQIFPSIPINIINDCRSAVLGVYCFEAEPDEKDNMGYVTISTGIGGGFIVNGRLILGKEGNASEVGHGSVAPKSGIRCNCGAVGCWEAFSSGTAIANRAKQALLDVPSDDSILLTLVEGDTGRITAKDVFEAAQNGDILAQSIVDQAIYYNAIGVGLINNYYDPKVLYFGGSVVLFQEILPPLQDLLAKNPIEFTINHPPLLKKTTLGDEVGLLGALALGKYQIEKNLVISSFI